MYFPIYQVVVFGFTLTAFLSGVIGGPKMKEDNYFPMAFSTSMATIGLAMFGFMVASPVVASVIDIVFAIINVSILAGLLAYGSYIDGFREAKALYQTEKLKNDLVGEDCELIDIHNEALPKTSLEQLR